MVGYDLNLLIDSCYLLQKQKKENNATVADGLKRFLKMKSSVFISSKNIIN